mgnify:CR=1 FL=1
MRQTIILFLLICLSMSSNAQKPSGLEGMKYQAVVRDAAGGILKNQSVSFRFSIIEGASVPVYIETHLLTTNEFGLVNLQIGRGAVSQGIFVDISWTVGSYFIEVEMDAAGGSNYKVLSTSEILSVPYAQFAGNVIYTDTSASNEIQTISLNNDTLYLSNGGFVDLKSYNTSVDLNRINARLDKDSIKLTDHDAKLELRRLADSAIVNKMVLDSTNMQIEINKNKTDISSHIANDLDVDSLNEIQNLMLIGDSLEISHGNKVMLPSKWDGTDSTIYTLKQVGIGTNSPDSSAILDVQSTSKGFLPPKMTKAQNNNVVNPSDGLLIYRTDTIPGLYLFQDSTWNKIEIQKNGSNNKTLIYTNDGF